MDCGDTLDVNSGGNSETQVTFSIDTDNIDNVAGIRFTTTDGPKALSPYLGWVLGLGFGVELAFRV